MIDAHGSPVGRQCRLELNAQQVSGVKFYFTAMMISPFSRAALPQFPACCVSFVSCIYLDPVVYQCLSLLYVSPDFQISDYRARLNGAGARLNGVGDPHGPPRSIKTVRICIIRMNIMRANTRRLGMSSM